MSGVGAGSARIRQRKVSLKHSIKVVHEKDLNDVANIDFGKDPLQVETGVEKHEEQEFHLQEILSQAIAPTKKVFIPTPNASTRWDDYKKYYVPKQLESKSYIRQSATVEDCSGCPYNMDEEDDEYLTKMNEKKEGKELCSEDEFEMIVYLFEMTVTKKQPFLGTDVSQLLEYDELEAGVISYLQGLDEDQQSLHNLLNRLKNSVFTPKWRRSSHHTEQESIKKFGPAIYTHYRARKIARDGRPITPQLKFETNSQVDDLDPYVCFRRRELRQTRKTRRTDQQSSERLRRLQAEMRQAKLLFEMVAKREQLRLQAVQADMDIFEQQCIFKAAKRKASIAGDDELLLTALVKRREEPRRLPVKKAPEPKVERVEKVETPKIEKVEKKPQPKVPSSKIPDLDHISIDQMIAERQEAIQNMIRTKLKARIGADHGWVNKTDDAFVPWVNSLDSVDTTTPDDLYCLLNSLYPPPPKRICLPLSHSLGRDFSQQFTQPQVIWAGTDSKNEVHLRRQITDAEIAPKDGVHAPRTTAVGLRKRIGRSGMQFIDRRNIVSSAGLEDDPELARVADRFKFDSDSHSDSAADIYGDPARLNGVQRSTQQVRFGSMLLSKSYEYLHEAQQQRQMRLKRKHPDSGSQLSGQNGTSQSSTSSSTQSSSSSSQTQTQTNQLQSQPSGQGANPNQGSGQNQSQNSGQNGNASGRSYPISVVSF